MGHGVRASTMFCTACGKEIPNEARFCNHCGSSQSAATTAGPAVGPVSGGARPPASNDLTDLHTFDWRGVCPSCKLVHTAENCSCSNEGSPMVVAFRDYRFGFYRYPVHAAELACLSDCGLRPNGFACTRCGAVVTGKNIRFRFPVKTRRLHLLLHSSVFLLSLSLVLFFAAFVLKLPVRPVVAAWEFVQNPKKGSDSMVNILIVFWCCALPAFIGLLMLQYFRPFARYNFAHVPRAAKKWAKEEARKESIKSARAVESDRKAREGWSIDGIVDGFTGKK